MCVGTVYSVLSRVLWKQTTGIITWIRTHNLYNSRAVSYLLDHRDCPVALTSISWREALQLLIVYISKDYFQSNMVWTIFLTILFKPQTLESEKRFKHYLF